MRTFLLLLFFTISLSAISQSNFSLSTPREVALFSSGVSFNLLGLIQSKNTSILIVENIKKLDRNDLDILDRTTTYNYSITAKNASDKFLAGSLILPAVSLITPCQSTQFTEKSIMILEAYLINAGTTLFVKSLVKRTRPFVYNENAPLSEKLTKDARMSFFSGHTSFVATSTFFTASLLTAHKQNQTLSPIIWTSAITLPAFQGFLRWKAGKHFPTDIFIGYVIGAGIGYLIPKMHEGF